MTETSLSTLPARLIIASRESPLAMWQAQRVRSLLLTHHPGLAVDILGMTTSGDRQLDTALSKIGGKGLFVKELEQALLDGRADLAVHSLKDVPMHLEAQFTLAAVGERADPRDALVSPRYATLGELPEGALVGTSSLRRQSQLKAAYPQLRFAALRGNLQTRMTKLDRGDYDAIVLAAAGLERLGLEARIRTRLPVSLSLPAVGQGVLGIETLAARSDVIDMLKPLDDGDARACVEAERAFSRALSGNCQVPIAAHATLKDGMLSLEGLVATPDGARVLRAMQSGATDAAEDIGARLAGELIARGAHAILAQCLNS